MKATKLLLLFILFTAPALIFAQTSLQVVELPDDDNQQGYNVDTLKAWVQDIFRGRGGMVDTTTIRFTGDRRAFGRFFDGVDVGFNKGLMISNGKVTSAQPPNSIGAMSDAFNEFDTLQPSGDLDLLDMYNAIFVGGLGLKDTALYYTGDAAALEFVYRPFGDEITMEYIFASEEYPSSIVQPSTDVDLTVFTGQPPFDQIFDMFGISVEMNNFHNLALMHIQNNPPMSEGQRWINVHTVNEGTNQTYYQPNPNYPPFGNVLGTQFDGLTKTIGELGPLLIQKKQVTPCGRYNVKIVIEDFYWNSPDPDQIPSGFEINSAVFLNEKSLRSRVQLTNTEYSDWSVHYYFIKPEFEGDLIEDCNHIVAIFTLEDSINRDYSIPFRIVPIGYRDNVEVAYDSGEVITNDSITFLAGETEKTITISTIDIDAYHTNISFQYPENPCDFPPPPPLSGGYHGRIHFNMRNNEPFAFTENPKVYEAYCKETLDLTITDITQNGVAPLFYRWNNDVMPHDTISYQVGSCPDFVQVTVNDLCANIDTAWVKINNRPIILETILDAYLCGPGQSVTVPVIASMPNYSDYSIDHVSWHKVSPYQYLGEANGNEMLVLYDDAVGPDIWTCGFEITDCCGGTATGTFMVNQSELTLGDDLNICNGDSKEIIANAAAQWYEWFATNDPYTILSTTNSVVVSPSVTTEYTLRILDLCDVEQTATITVVVDLFEPEIFIDPISAEICPGETIVLSANDALEWKWTPGDETTQSITLNPTIPTTYHYTLTASSEYCIDKITVVSFEVFPIPVAEFSFVPADDACTGEPINFHYSGVVTNDILTWDFDDGSPASNETDPVHTYVNPGTYNVQLHVDKYICENDTSMEMTINPLPSPGFSTDVIDGCLPVDVQFYDESNDVQPGAGYEWTFGDGGTSNNHGNASHTYSQAGLFTVSLTVSNTQRCAQTITKPNLIKVSPNPDADFEADPWITTLDTPTIDFSDLSISDSAIMSYEWDFGDGETSNEENPSHTYTRPGEFDIMLHIETINGCWDTAYARVALTEEVRLFIPNAFTPNGDGVNDKFEIKGTPIADFNLYIFDRWGKIIWSTHNYETQWDGADKSGNAVKPGTYVYQISGTDYLIQPINFKGTVTVIR